MTRRFQVLGWSLGIFVAGGALAGAGDAVSDLIKTLQKGKRAEERAEAANSLGGNKDPRAIDALALALSDREANVREAAASALWETGEKAAAAKPALLKALEDSPGRVIVRAAGALEVMGVSREELADARRRVLDRRTDDTTAFLAARGLIGLDPPATVLPGLLRYLALNAAAAARPDGSSDDRDNVAEAERALQKLAETKDRSAIPPLKEELDRTPAAAPSLLKTLAAFKPPPERLAQTLVEQMDARSAKTREVAARLCRELTTDKDVAVWAPEAAVLTRDRDESVRMEAIGALQAASGRAAASAPDLVRLLKGDPSASVRKRAAQALGDVGDAAQAVPQNAKVQVAEQAKDALIAAVADKDKDVAEEALNSYNRLFLPSAEVVATLMQLAEGRGPAPVRQRALTLLGRRQGQGKAVLQRVRALTPSAEVAREAKEAAEWIERGGPGSPNPLTTGAAAKPAPSASSTGSVAPAPGAAKHDPGAEARGLATLRDLKIEFDEGGFYRTLSEAQLEGVRGFLDAGMSPNHRFAVSSERSPLLVLFFGSACTAGEPTSETTREVVKALLAAGADVNQTDENRNTPLMFAAEKCDRFTLRLLLTAGAKLAMRNQSNLNALEGSIFSGNPGVEELIAAGARLDPKTAKDYLDAYKDNPKAIALVRKATPK